MFWTGIYTVVVKERWLCAFMNPNDHCSMRGGHYLSPGGALKSRGHRFHTSSNGGGHRLPQGSRLFLVHYRTLSVRRGSLFSRRLICRPALYIIINERSLTFYSVPRFSCQRLYWYFSHRLWGTTYKSSHEYSNVNNSQKNINIITD